MSSISSIVSHWKSFRAGLLSAGSASRKSTSSQELSRCGGSDVDFFDYESFVYGSLEASDAGHPGLLRLFAKVEYDQGGRRAWLPPASNLPLNLLNDPPSGPQYPQRERGT